MLSNPTSRKRFAWKKWQSKNHLWFKPKYSVSVETHYTGYNRRNGPDFGRVFLMLKYTDITQNTDVQSWTVTEIMARETCGLLAYSTHCTGQLSLLGREGSYTHTTGITHIKISWHSYRVSPSDLVSHYGSRKGRW
jgi:hypothetical protein